MSEKSVQCFGFYVSAEWPNKRAKIEISPEEEANLRASALFHALLEANGHKSSEKGVAKIFMAPEFFFQDERGATRVDDGAIGTALNVFVDLLTKNADTLGNGWFIVMGGGNEYTNEGADDDDGSNIVPWNMTPVVSIDSAGKTKIRTVLKNYTSHIDYGDPNAQGGTDNYTLGGRARPKLSIGKAHQAIPQDDGGGIFDFDGMKIGVEICLDHYRGVLDQPGLPIRLLSSGGMEFEPSKLSSDTQLAFNVDCLRPLDDDAVVLYRKGVVKVDRKGEAPIVRLSNDHLFQGSDGPPTLVYYDPVKITV